MELKEQGENEQGGQKEGQQDDKQQDEGKLTVSVSPNSNTAANPNNLISISIGVKYGEAGPSTNLNFAFDPDCPQDLIL